MLIDRGANMGHNKNSNARFRSTACDKDVDSAMITKDIADTERDNLCTVDYSLLGRAVCYSGSL